MARDLYPGDSVKVIKGRHQGKNGRVLDITEDKMFVGVEFLPGDIQFIWVDEVMKLRGTQAGAG